jgi:hypothetical protein
MRRHLLPLVSLGLAALIAVAALVDHSWKQRRIYRVEVAAWYCEHQGLDCEHTSWAAIERHWNQRQLAYEIAVALFGASGLVLAAYRRARR